MAVSGSILVCDCCEHSSARTERGWLALLLPGPGGEAHVAIVCPVCAKIYLDDDDRGDRENRAEQ
jgi:hypothetical protein